MGGHAVGDGAGQNLDAEGWDIAELGAAVRVGIDCLGDVPPDLEAVDVERCDELDVVDVVAPEVHVHEARNLALLLVTIVFDALYEGRGAVPEAGYRDADLTQPDKPP